MELVTYEERSDIFNKKKYDMQGDVMKYPVVNLAWICKKIKEERTAAKMSPYIDIKPLIEDVYKDINISFSVEKDPEFGTLYGIVTGFYPDGGIRWKKITIHNHLTLNLNREDDLKTWAILRYWSKIKGSPFQIESAPFYVYDPEVEANKDIESDEALFIALGRIGELKGKPLAFFARTLGVYVNSDASPKTIRFEISKTMKANPIEFNKNFESAERGICECFYNGKALSIIKEDLNVGFKFRSHIIGGSPEGCIKWFKENPEMFRECMKEIEEKDTASINLEKFIEDSPKGRHKKSSEEEM